MEEQLFKLGKHTAREITNLLLKTQYEEMELEVAGFVKLRWQDCGGEIRIMGHVKPSNKTGIGKKRWNGAEREESLKRTQFKPRFTRIRKVSAKQRRRTNELGKKLKVMIRVQEMHGYNPHCQKCLAARFEGNELALYADHLGTRNQKDADRYGNLGVLCYACNSKKGSVREADYRPEWFKAAMLELDEALNPKETL